MKREGRHLRSYDGLFLCVASFSLLFLMAMEGKAADLSADYPSRPIECVVHVPAGGTNDRLARMVSEIIQKEKILSQPLVVMNKVGGSGAVSFGYVFEKKGNPHLVLTVASSVLAGTPLLEKLPYNYKSFTPIANMMADGSLLVVRSDSLFKSVDDIFAEARKRPKELIQGGASITSNENMLGRSMQKMKGVQWNFLSFAGGRNEALLNVLSGNVHFAFADPPFVLDHVSAGKLRVLLAVAKDRYPQFKDVPTVEEAGLGESFLQYRGFVGPPNMPDYAVKKLEAAFKKVMESDRFEKYIKEGLMEPAWMSSQEYGKFLEEESARWEGSLNELGLLKKK
jgi:putative tricarboxylic transport membrane protein